MKKTIRMNEQELHRLISEAVNELDWKTYANAARKWYNTLLNNPDHPKRKSSILGHENSKSDHDIHTDDRLRKFQDAAQKAFNDEFGFNSDNSTHSDGSYGMSSKYGSGINQQKGYYDNIQTTTRTPQGSKGKGQLRDTFYLDSFDGQDKYPSKRHVAHVGLDNYSGFGNFPEYSDRPAIEPEWDKLPYMAARNKGNAEIEKYQNGDYVFDKLTGKWTDDKSKDGGVIIPQDSLESLPSEIADRVQQPFSYGIEVYADGELESDLGNDLVYLYNFNKNKLSGNIPCQVYGIDRPCEMVYAGISPTRTPYFLVRYKDSNNETLNEAIHKTIRKYLR